MKAKEFTTLGKGLTPYLTGFTTYKKMLFLSPIGDFLRGVYFEDSCDPKSFYLRMFFLPLYVPTEEVYFNYGKRLGNPSNWDMENPRLLGDLFDSITNEASPFLNNLSTIEDVLNFLQIRAAGTRPRVNPHTLEALAYTAIKFGDYDVALETLTELERENSDATTQWEQEQRSRAQLIKEKLLQNPEMAMAQLDEWKKYTIKNLKLEAFILPS